MRGRIQVNKRRPDPNSRVTTARAASTKLINDSLKSLRDYDVPGANRSYHISNELGFCGIVHSIAAIGAFVRGHGPGSYIVDEHFPHPFKAHVNSTRAWGNVTYHLGGKVAIVVAPFSALD